MNPSLLLRKVPICFSLVPRRLLLTALALLLLLDGLPAPAALVAAWGGGSWQQTCLPNGLDQVKAIAAGTRHSIAVKTDGTVVAWNFTGEGWGTNVPAGLSGVVAVAARSSFSLALRADGTVVGWDGWPTDPPISSLSNITAVAAGYQHWLALRSDGTVATGRASFAAADTTNAPPGLTNIIAVAAGNDFSLALRSDGTVAAWGINTLGQTNVPAGLSNVVAIAAGRSHSLALNADGTVVGWGAVGDPVVPEGLSNVVAVAAGARHNLALKADGRVVAWWAALQGNPDLGQTLIPPGLSNVMAIAAGERHNLALVFEGPPAIVEQPASLETPWQSNAVFTVSATGHTPMAYQWRFNGSAMTNNARISGAMTPSLSIVNAQFEDAGNYSVIVSNALGSVLSANAGLAVLGPPQITAVTSNLTVGAGTFVALSVTAAGTPPLAYQWMWHGTNLPGRTTSFLHLSNAQPEASGDYSVTVSNAFGSATAAIHLLVTNRAPVITTQPSLLETNLRGGSLSSPVPVGTGVGMQVFAVGSQPLRYQWRRDGVDLAGATNSFLVLPQLAPEHSGNYSVVVSNDFGWTNSVKVLLNVSQVAVAGLPLAGSTNLPLGLTGVTALAAGGSHVAALITNGSVRTWLANGNYVAGFPHGVTNIPASVSNVIAVAAGRDHCLVLRSNGTVVAWGGPGFHTNIHFSPSNAVAIAAGPASSYAIRADGTVTNWGGSVLPASITNVAALAVGDASRYAVLRRDGTVAYVDSGGVITPQIPGLSNAIAVAAFEAECRALRADGTVLRWLSGAATQPGLVLEGRDPVTNVVAIALGAGRSSLMLKEDGTLLASGFPTGTGWVSVTNNLTAIAAGGYSAPFAAMLVGDGAPAITLHPLGQVVAKGGTVMLHARAAGNPPLHYQWQQDGVDMPGATNASLTLSNLLGRNTGGYRLVVSNLLGTTASRAAVLAMPFSTNLPAALNATDLAWTTYASALPAGPQMTNGWFAQIRETHDDDTAAQSGPIAHHQQSLLQTTVTGPGLLSFWWKVSSEPGYDFLRLFWNNMGVAYASISGETDWRQVTLTLGSGTHTLRWAYVKDGSVNAGRDAGWLDEVRFVAAPAIALQPVSQTVALGTNVTMSGSATGAAPLSYQWLKNGTNLPDATTASLTLTNVARRDSASYALRVCNEAGCVTSSNAVLRVLVPQILSGATMLADGTFEARCRDADDSPLEPPLLDAFEARASTNLLHWETLPGALSLTNGWLWLRDTNAPAHPRRFYRILER